MMPEVNVTHVSPATVGKSSQMDLKRTSAFSFDFNDRFIEKSRRAFGTFGTIWDIWIFY
jgi:hypothetical protein